MCQDLLCVETHVDGVNSLVRLFGLATTLAGDVHVSLGDEYIAIGHWHFLQDVLSTVSKTNLYQALDEALLLMDHANQERYSLAVVASCRVS